MDSLIFLSLDDNETFNNEDIQNFAKSLKEYLSEDLIQHLVVCLQED